MKDITILDTGLTDRNGRTYSKEALKRQIERFEDGAWKSVVGEFGIGEGNSVALDKVSHKIVDIRFEDGKMIGTVQFLDTPMGRVASALDNAKLPLVTAMRGIGKLDERGFVTEYELIGIDVIADPLLEKERQ